jgi:hypothetical protein
MKEMEEEIYYNHYEILKDTGDRRGAKRYLTKANEEKTRKARLISDTDTKKSFLEKVIFNQRISEAWEHERVAVARLSARQAVGPNRAGIRRERQ